jgi:sugar transferase (PEP-CTERM/EpsH1 system associated)
MNERRTPLIAHVIFRLDIGGLENGIVNLINNMPAASYRHAVVCLNGFNAKFRSRVTRADVDVISIDKRPGKDPAANWRMWRALRRLRPDIVHTRNLGTIDMQWVAAAAGVRHRVHGEHGWNASDPEGLSPRGLRTRRACGWAIDRHVPMSMDIRNWLIQTVGVPRGRVTQVYSGVDAMRFAPRNGGTIASCTPGVVTIGTVGRPDPVKNQQELLRVFASARQTLPSIRLIFVGDGPLRASLEQAAADLGIDGSVTFTGACNDTAPAMRQIDIFVLPSRNEGNSNTVLEAMATGLHVVAARVGGNPELVKDGVTGCLYDESDPKSLERGLRRYIEGTRLSNAHGIAGRERVLSSFSLESIVACYQDLYDSLIKEPSVRSGTRPV